MIPGIKEKALLLMDEGVPVESVYVEVWDDDAVRHEAAAEIKAVGGRVEWDLRLGATESDTTHCLTCNQGYPRCPGHWGFIEIGSSRNNYLRSSYVHKQLPTMLLNCICFHCRRPYYDFDAVVSTRPKLTGNKLSACFDYMVGKKNNLCSVCGKNAFVVYEEENRNPKMNKFSEIELSDGKKENTMNLPVHIFRRILLGLSKESRRTLGVEGLDTEDFFFSVLPVMPNTLRPKRNFEDKESSHQFTVLYEKIAKLAEDMKLLADQSSYKTHYDLERELYYERIYVETLLELSRVKPEILTLEEREIVSKTSISDLERLQSRHEREIDELKRRNRENKEFEVWKTKRRILNLHVREFDNAYGKQTFQVKLPVGVDRFAPILKKSEGINVDMNTLVKSKHGLVREKIMGKRVNFCARTVASPAPFRSRADEVWVPEKFRNTLLMTEDVTEDLKQTLQRMADNRMVLYVILKNPKHRDVPFFGERTRWSEYLRYLRTSNIRTPAVEHLEEGDVVERQLIDGVNYIMLNRQPSIWRYSLGAFRVRFWDNATIGVPEVALKAFNGDFDGDEFNLWTIRDRATEAEVIQIYSPVKNVLGNARNSTAYGLHFDPVTGIFLITRVVERKLPIPVIDGDYGKIADFLGKVESRYFEEQDEKLTSRRYFRVFLREEGPNKTIVFSSETVVPRDYFIDEVREHILNMKGANLGGFHESLRRNKLFFIPDSETNLRDLGRSYTGRAAFSLLLPKDFYFDNGKIKVEAGVLVKGTIGKSEIGAFSHSTIFHELTRLYGYNVCSQVIDSIVWFTKTYLTRGNTLSFGLEDYGFVGREAERETDRVVWVRKLVAEYKALYETLKEVAGDFARSTPELGIRNMNRVLGEVKQLRATEEVKGFLAKYCTTESEEEARGLLLAAASLEEKNEALYQDARRNIEELERLKREAGIKREFVKVEELEGNIVDLLNGLRAQEAKNIESVIDPENAFLKCEGKRGNIFEVMGSVGLQTVSGKRIHTGTASNRALPSIFPGDTSPEALGMVLGNFTRGLDPAEAAFLAWAARIGPVVTKTQTSVIGDIANRMTNAFQGIAIKDGIPQEMVRETSNYVQMAYGYDNLDPKFMLARKGDQSFRADQLPESRSDYKTDKPGQTPIDTASLQVRLNAMGGPVSQISSEGELGMVREFLRTHVVNQYAIRGSTVPARDVYVVRGISFPTTQKTTNNVRGILFQSVSVLRFPQGSNRERVIEDTLRDMIFRMTGVRSETGERVVDNVQIGQGEKVGRYISGAIQQPIMQAALNTFHASGQASSASTVKDRFIRLVTASSSGKRSGTMFMNKIPQTFYEAYARRNQIREVSLASILKEPLPEMRYGVSPQTVPEIVRKLLVIDQPRAGASILGKETISYLIFDYDPLIVRTAELEISDVKRFIRETSVTDFQIYPVILESRDPRIYVFTDEDSTLKARNNFQSNLIARLSDHKLNFGYRASGEGIDDAYPTEFNILEGVQTMYRTVQGYELTMNARHMNRYGYSMADVVEIFTTAGVGTPRRNGDRGLLFSESQTSPLAVVKRRIAEEEAVVEKAWKESVEANQKKEPEEPGSVTRLVKRYYLKTIGGNLSCMLRHPLVNYRSSYTDGIQDIEAMLGLRAARNFMVHEIEQIFSLSGSNEIDYRHVVLMIDSMVSQGTISRLTFQGVDKIAGPNPLNQAGVGYAPANTFAVAALKKKEFRTDVGYAVNFLATRPRTIRGREEEERETKKTQEQRIKEYVSRLSGLKRGVEKVDYQVIREQKIREREVIEHEEGGSTLESILPSDVPRVCRKVIPADSFAFANDLNGFFGTDMETAAALLG